MTPYETSADIQRSGVGKLGAVEDTQKYMEAYGVPGYLIWPAAALEIGGGIMLLIGWRTRQLAVVLAAWCVLTAAIFHVDLEDPNVRIQKSRTSCEILVGLHRLVSAKDQLPEEPGYGRWVLDTVGPRYVKRLRRPVTFADCGAGAPGMSMLAGSKAAPDEERKGM